MQSFIQNMTFLNQKELMGRHPQSWRIIKNTTTMLEQAKQYMAEAQMGPSQMGKVPDMADFMKAMSGMVPPEQAKVPVEPQISPEIELLAEEFKKGFKMLGKQIALMKPKK